MNQYIVHKFSLQSVAANAHIHWQRITCEKVLQMETRSVKGKGLQLYYPIYPSYFQTKRIYFFG